MLVHVCWRGFKVVMRPSIQSCSRVRLLNVHVVGGATLEVTCLLALLGNNRRQKNLTWDLLIIFVKQKILVACL